MRLRISTPMAVVVDTDQAHHVRVEDKSGALGVLAHHADLLTVLEPSVLTWRDGDGTEHHVALRGGVFSVVDGSVAVATREAVPGDDLIALEEEVVTRFRAAREAEIAARLGTARVQLAALQQMTRYLRGTGRPLRGTGRPLRGREDL
ncbi:MAG TPA: F0F1 ATP synthase subunit epsilon [Polyangiaceae bacterium]|nr:F0F1 ATP synthase subunit epsilon [Polyangiaceae bacterium]